MDRYRAALIFVTGVNLLALIRLITVRAPRRLPVLFIFLVYQLIQNLLGVLMSATSRRYQDLYTVTEPLNWVLYLLVIWEMYRRAFSGFPGVASIARWACYISVGAAGVIGTIVASLPQSIALDAKFSYVAFWEKCTCFALAAFILLMIFLLSRYPVQVGWNEALSIVTFTVYFFGNFAALEVSAAGSVEIMTIRNYALLLLCGMCYLAWGLLLKSDADLPNVQVRANLDAFEERRLMDQLASLNNLLVKAGRH